MMGPKKRPLASSSPSDFNSLTKSNDSIVASLIGATLGNRWSICKFLGEGACAKVFDAKCARDTNDITYDVVIKVISLGNGKGKVGKDQLRLANTLNYEKDLYVGALYDFPFRPQTPLRCYGEDTTLNVRYLVMEKMGCDLKQFAQNQKPTSQHIASIGIQIIDGMEWLHQKGMLFIDSKPANFMLTSDGSGPGPFQVKFVDFGCVERYISYDGSGIRARGKRTPVGTPAFQSVDVHDGYDPARKDDMESVALVLLSLPTSASLPWHTCTTDKQCREMKAQADIINMAKDAGILEVGQMLIACRTLAYADIPAYTAYRTLLNTLATKSNNQSDASRSKNNSLVENTKCSPSTPILSVDSHTDALDAGMKGCSTIKRVRNKSNINTTNVIDDVLHSQSVDNNVSRKLPRLHLYGLNGPYHHHTFILLNSEETKATVTVTGHGQNNTITNSTHVVVDLSNDAFVSTVHCSLEVSYDIAQTKRAVKRKTSNDVKNATEGILRVRIRDEGSTNGTSVNGALLVAHTWTDIECMPDENYALLKIGKSTFVMPFM